MSDPITREETFLAAAAGESVTLPTPVTREEMFLAKLAGEDVKTPTPITRKEMFLEAAAQGGGGGGGNPNYVETIEGTLANPWGDKNPSELFSEAKANQITMSMMVDGEPVSLPNFSVVFYPYADANYFEVVGSSAPSVDEWIAGTIGYSNSGELLTFYLLQGSTALTLTDYASLLTTTLTIIHHPLTEDNT